MGMIIQNGKQYFPVYNDTEIKALPTVSTASGSVATFETDMTENLVEVKCQIVAQQSGSGTPSPSNPRPILTYDSLTLYHNDINMWDEQWQVYGSGATARIGSKNPIPCVGGRTYYLTSTPSYGWKFYDIEGNVVLTYYNKTCIAPDNAVYMMFQLDDTYGTVYNHDISLNYPATDTEYHAFNGAYIPFGQTVANGVLDVTTGKLRVTYGYADLGSLTWSKSSTGNKYYCTFTEPYYKFVSNCQMACEIFAFDGIGNSQVGYYGNDNTVRYYFASGSPTYELYVHAEDYTSASDFQTAVNGKYLTYELETLYDIQLDSTQITALLNENNIWCDTGDTEVKYLLTVGKKIA